MKSRLTLLNIHMHMNEYSYMYKHTAIFQSLKRRPAFDLDSQAEVRFHFLKDSKGRVGDCWM